MPDIRPTDPDANPEPQTLFETWMGMTEAEWDALGADDPADE